MQNYTASKTNQLLKKSIIYKAFTLVIIVLALVTDVTAQTPDFYSGELKAKSSISNVDYLGLMNSNDSRVVIIDHNTNTELFDLVPNFDSPAMVSYILDGMIAAAPNGNYAVGAQVQNFPRETAVNFNISGSFDNARRISSNIDGGYGLNALQVIDNKFVMVFGLYSVVDTIAVAANWGNPIATYNTTIGGAQYVIVSTDLDGSNPVVLASLHGFNPVIINVKRNDILHELNGNLLLKFKIAGTQNIKYFEIDKTTGNTITTYDYGGPFDMVQDTSTGNIFVAYGSYDPAAAAWPTVLRDTIVVYDSLMNPLGIKSPRLTRSILGIELVNDYVVAKFGDYRFPEKVEEYLHLSKDCLSPRFSVKMNSWDLYDETIFTQFDSVGNMNITYSYTGTPEDIYNNTISDINGTPLVPNPSGYTTVSYIKQMANPNLSLTGTNTSPIISVLQSTMLGLNGVSSTDNHSFVLLFESDFYFDTIQYVNFNWLDIQSGTNIWPNPAVSSVGRANFAKFSLGNIQQDKYGNYFIYIGVYDNSAIMNIFYSNMNKKYFKVYLKNAPDTDSDGIADIQDNCINIANPNQEDFDNDTIGDICDDDDDNDMVLDVNDVFPFDQTEWEDTDTDNIGNNADTDDDNDGYSDAIELAEGTNSLDSTSTPADYDGDFIPDSTDEDIDGDGVANTEDAFPNDETETEDFDQDNIGNNADPDDDNDGYNDDVDDFPFDSTEWADADNDSIGDNTDNCINTPNYNQADFDQDNIGDLCDEDDDNDGVLDSEDAFPYDDTKWEIETSIEKVVDLQVNIYPNPVGEVLFIESEITLHNVEVLDYLGRGILIQTSGLDKIKVSALSKGMYFVKLSVDGEFVIRRFVKG